MDNDERRNIAENMCYHQPDPRYTSEIAPCEPAVCLTYAELHKVRMEAREDGAREAVAKERARIISVLISKVECPDWPCPEDVTLCSMCWAKYLDTPKEADNAR